MNKLIAIVGPTAVGKSRLALHLAREFTGEIVSADSRQIYHFMDIGTAKPSRQEISLIPHHLIDIIKPNETFSLAQYQKLASQAIDAIILRKRLPLLVGGSGQYVWSVVEGWGIPKVPPDPEFRHKLEKRAARGDSEELYQELLMRDPKTAGRIDQNNIRRVIRALEINKAGYELVNKKLINSVTYNVLIIGLTMDRGILYRRIDSRIDNMVERGFVEEVKGLINMGYRLNLPALSSIGYRQIGDFLEGRTTLEAAIQQIKYETHRFVRQQYNWFSQKDGRIKWYDLQKKVEPEIMKLVDSFIRKV
ncbi:MAG: tRNA (adenosine(37)-N6)-dimethylallyltransferase MiaA [Dehalococcoidia bacterium]|nr:MAG: tRNA (adenosine(37)-N6)-dimethylallyltransferase MiaA [Dehalococcoidia bacterium]